MTFAASSKELLIVTAGYAVLTFLMALPFSASPGSQVLGDVADMHLFIWTLGWDAHAFVTQPLHIFDANIYYPFANTLAYSENLIGTAFFAAPVIWLTGNLVLATNLAALLTCVLCGVGAYLLARRLHLSAGAAFICGLVFAFAPARFIRIGQLHLTAIQWMPFSLAFLHSYWEAGRRRDLLLAVACFSLQALCSGHGATYLVVVIAILTSWQLAFGAPLALGRRLKDFGVAGLYLAAPAVWILMPYRLAQTEAGLKRGYLADAHPNFESFIASPSRVHQFLQARFWGAFEREPDAFLFPGILVMLLAAIAVFDWRGRRRLREHYVAFYLVVAILATLMFIDRPFDLWRHVYWLPGFNFIRVPSRFILLTMLALSVLAAFGVERLMARASLTVRPMIIVGVSTLLLAEFATYPFAGQPFQLNVPAVDRWLDTQPKPFVVAELPMPSPGNLGAHIRWQTQAMLHSTAHWQKTIHGYSGIQRPLHDQLYVELNAFPSPASIDALRSVGVTYVAVHTAEYGERWSAVESLIAKTPALRLEHVDGAGRVYALLPP